MVETTMASNQKLAPAHFPSVWLLAIEPHHAIVSVASHRITPLDSVHSSLQSLPLLFCASPRQPPPAQLNLGLHLAPRRPLAPPPATLATPSSFLSPVGISR